MDLTTPFKPCAIYYPDADQTELVISDAPMFWKAYGYGIELGYDMETKQLVAVRLFDDDFTKPVSR